MPLISIAPDQVVDRPGGDPVHIGLLHHRGQRLLGHPSRFQKSQEVGSLAQLRDAELDRAGPGLPIAVAVPRIRLVIATRPYWRIIDDQAKPLARHSAMWGRTHERLR